MGERELFEAAPEAVEPEVVTEPEPEESGVGIVPMIQAKTKQAIQNAQKRAVERIEALKALKAAALTFTSAEDWVFHKAEDGSLMPYLEETGAEKLMHAFAVEIEKLSERVVDYPEDETYEIVIDGRVRAQVFSDLWYPETGSRWSGDGFFSRAGSVRIDPGDVRKAASANFYNRAIKKVLGLRGMTVDDLEKVTTIDTNKIRTVTYTSGGGPGGGRASVTDILKVKHVVVFIPYEDATNRKIWTDKFKGKTAFHKEPHPVVNHKNVWVVPHSEEAEKLAADLAAANGKIHWKVIEPSGNGDTDAADTG